METAPPAAVVGGISSPPGIIPARCTGCGRCVAACPLHLLTLEVSGYRKYALLTDAGRCSRCGSCAEACLVGAVAARDSFLQDEG